MGTVELIHVTFLLSAAAVGPQPDPKPGLSFDPSAPVVLLADTPKVQAELKLDAGQLAKVKDLRVKAEDLTDAEAWKRLADVLDARSLKRLKELRAQARGGSALVLPDVANELKLTAGQTKELAGLWADATRDLEARLRTIRFKSDADRRTFILAYLRKAGEPMARVLTAEQRKAFRTLQGTPFPVEKLFDGGK